MTTPLRSGAITAPSSLLRAFPPLCSASVLWPLRLLTAWVSPFDIRATGSCVPCQSLSQSHAAFMPDAGWAVGRLPPTLARGIDIQIPVSTSIGHVTTRHQRFTRVRLLGPYLTEFLPPFPQRSPPGLFTLAAWGGLKSAPADRLRRAILHL